MKKNVFKILILTFLVFIVTGCDLEEITQKVEEQNKPNVSCSIDKQYKDKSNIGYYIEGTCANKGTKEYDYLQVEFICYDKEGNNLGTALDNTNNLLGGQTWKYKAIFLNSDVKSIDHCDYHEVTGW